MCTPTQGVWQPAGCVSCELVCVCVSLVRVVIICPASTHTALVSSPSLTVCSSFYIHTCLWARAMCVCLPCICCFTRTSLRLPVDDESRRRSGSTTSRLSKRSGGGSRPLGGGGEGGGGEGKGGLGGTAGCSLARPSPRRPLPLFGKLFFHMA